MGHHPDSVSWCARDEEERLCSKKRERFSDEQCVFINDNVGISRRTLKDVATMFNTMFNTTLSYQEFLKLRSEAISEGRCRTTYFRNYFKGENSSERELRRQKPVIKSRLIGGCQYQISESGLSCGAKTIGRFCEDHVHLGHTVSSDTRRGVDYIDSSLGKYG